MKILEKQNLHRLLWLANVQQFFPDKPASLLWEHYKIWLNNRDAFQKLYQGFPLQKLCEMGIPEIAQGAINGILITFHYGPYRLLPKLLVQQGYQVTLLASAAILKREERYYSAELLDAGLPQHRLECIDANKAQSLRNILKAIKNNRLVIVFLDADEGMHNDAEMISEHRVAVPFGSHYFFWRTNILKLASRFQIPVHCSFISHADTALKWQLAPFLKVMNNGQETIEDSMMQALSNLQMAFQQMMNQGWIYWENWAFIHHYNGSTAIDKRGITAQGSWLAPLEYNDKKYLFDVKNRQLFEIKLVFPLVNC